MKTSNAFSETKLNMLWIIEVGKLLNTFFWFINHIKTKICLLYLLKKTTTQKINCNRSHKLLRCPKKLPHGLDSCCRMTVHLKHKIIVLKLLLYPKGVCIFSDKAALIHLFKNTCSLSFNSIKSNIHLLFFRESV